MLRSKRTPLYRTKLWREFTKIDLKAFRKNWVDSYIVETGVEEETAEIFFEQFCGQEGWTSRDQRIMLVREHESAAFC